MRFRHSVSVSVTVVCPVSVLAVAVVKIVVKLSDGINSKLIQRMWRGMMHCNVGLCESSRRRGSVHFGIYNIAGVGW